jgi:hypothetical protein
MFTDINSEDRLVQTTRRTGDVRLPRLMSGEIELATIGHK